VNDGPSSPPAGPLSGSLSRTAEVERLLGAPSNLASPIPEAFNRLRDSLNRRLGTFDLGSELDRKPEARPTDAGAAALPPLTGVVVWLKAFIPLDVPGLTRPAPGWGDATMVDHPLIPGCYLTDSRGFSPDWNASARMTSVVAIFPPTMEMDQLHYCDYTVRLDCDSGAVTCHQQADASRMTFLNFRGVAGYNQEVDLVGAGANPCAFGAQWFGDIDYNGSLAVDAPSRQVLFQGYVEPFPAFEMYAVALSGPVPDPLIGAPLFQKPPLPGATPLDLPGPANQFVWGIVTV
jgi:hypothetical protein